MKICLNRNATVNSSRMKVLIIVHVEDQFDGPIRKDLGDDFDEKIVRYAENFDKTISVVSYKGLGGDGYPLLKQFHEEEWIWGYDADYYKDDPDCTNVEGIDFIPTTGHSFSLIEEWMKNLSKTDQYTLIGGCRWECLQDVKEIFEHLKLKTKLNNRYIYGL